MLERRRQEPERGLTVGAVAPEACDAGVALEHCQPDGSGHPVGLTHLLGDLVGGDRPQRRDALGWGERDVPAGHLFVRMLLQPLPGHGVTLFEHRPEPGLGHLSGDVEDAGPAALPASWRIALTGQVVVPIVGHLVEVIVR
jgi:hypothetical protein